MASAASINNVIESGTCVGCGACSVRSHGRIPIARSSFGAMRAEQGAASAQDLADASAVCPFSNDAVNEDVIARELFSSPATDKRIGVIDAIFAGRVAEGENIELSSSGGMTSWLTLKLLEAGRIDGVIHVAASSDDGALFEYVVSTTPEELRHRRKSQYYSTSLGDVVRQIRGDGRRYALVGVPCFVKAARLLARQDEVFRGQLALCIGLVCGHLKSSGFAELLAWQVGVEPKELAKVDFRVKRAGEDAADYGFSAWRRGDPTPKTKATRQLLGGNWGHAMFQLKACDYCDDVFAETADVAFGDAWLPQYASDWRGTNVIVSRRPEITQLIQDGQRRGEIFLETLSADDAARSQAGNYRHRWDGLSLRLADDVAKKRWVPIKRIAPGSRPVTRSRARIIRLRRRLAELSHVSFAEAKATGSLAVFESAVRPIIDVMDREYWAAEAPGLRGVLRRMKWILTSTLRRIRSRKLSSAA